MRLCAVCKKGVRDGDVPHAIRLAPEDCTPELLVTLRITHPVLPGLQSACGDCVEALRPLIAARLGVDPATLTEGFMN
jgi:bacterioferritin-associated ferredoxin